MSDQRIFQVFKRAVDGSPDRWGYVARLTHNEARDLQRFPGGTHEDNGRRFAWGYSLMPGSY